MNTENKNTAAKRVRFTAYQKKSVCLCLAAYCCAYLLRVNFSVAIPDMRASLGFTEDMTGVISAAFLWCYAIGQLISGRLGDKFSAKAMIGTGLCVSCAANAVLAFTDDYRLMIAAWAINGIFQSMLWAPIVHFLAQNFEGKALLKASFLMSFSLIFGYMFSWSSSAVLADIFNWRYIFAIPAAVGAVFLIIWFIFFREDPSQLVPEAVSGTGSSPRPSVLKNKLMTAVIIFTVLSAVTHGMVKESINTWLPTMLADVGSFSTESTVGILLFVPCINFLGVLFSRRLLKRPGSDTYITARIIVLISLSVAALAALTAFLPANIQPFALVGLTILLFCLMFALNPVFTSFMPLHFVRYGIVGTMAGLIDFSIYFGAAFSSMLTGILYGRSGSWNGVTLMWVITMAVCLVTSVFAETFFKKAKNDR